MRQFTLVCALLTAGCVRAASVAHAADPLPVFDAHLHYSHDAWEVVSPKEVVGLLRKAGVKRALVSSSNDDGTQARYKEAPDLVIPELRPYRTRGEVVHLVMRAPSTPRRSSLRCQPLMRSTRCHAPPARRSTSRFPSRSTGEWMPSATHTSSASPQACSIARARWAIWIAAPLAPGTRSKAA